MQSQGEISISGNLSINCVNGRKFAFLYVRRKLEISSVLVSVFFQTTDLQADIVCYAVSGDGTMRTKKK